MFNNLKPYKKTSYLFLLISMLSIPIAVSLVLNPKEFRLPRADTPITPPQTPPSTPITPPTSPGPGSAPPSPGSRRNGDANADNRVDGLDYVVWLRYFDNPAENAADQADFDGNGWVDGLDYVIWLSNFDN